MNRRKKRERKRNKVVSLLKTQIKSVEFKKVMYFCNKNKVQYMVPSPLQASMTKETFRDI